MLSLEGYKPPHLMGVCMSDDVELYICKDCIGYECYCASSNGTPDSCPKFKKPCKWVLGV